MIIDTDKLRKALLQEECEEQVRIDAITSASTQDMCSRQAEAFSVHRHGVIDAIERMARTLLEVAATGDEQ